MFLVIIFTLVIPMVSLFLAEKLIKVAGFPRLLLAISSAVPLFAGYGHWSELSNAEFFGVLLLSVLSMFCFFINAVKAFIPSK